MVQGPHQLHHLLGGLGKINPPHRGGAIMAQMNRPL
jgi:hypothetical protein